MLSKLFSVNRSAPVVGIDISSTSIKLIELSPVGTQYCIESYGVSSLPEGAVIENVIKDVDQVAQALKKVIQRSKTKAIDAAIAVPSSSVIHKTIQMEADLSPRDLEHIISLEAEKHIPYPIEEVSYDFFPMGASSKYPNMIDVLISACRGEHVDARVDVLEAAELTPKIVDVESYAIERSCARLLKSSGGYDEENLVAIVDIGSTLTTITILKNRQILYTRQENFGGGVLTEMIKEHYSLSFDEARVAKKQGGLPDDYNSVLLEPFKESVASQIRRSLQYFYSSSQEEEVNHIILAGGTSAIPGLAELVEKNLKINTNVADPFANAIMPSSINVSSISNDAPALMVACGLALRGVEHGPN